MSVTNGDNMVGKEEFSQMMARVDGQLSAANIPSTLPPSSCDVTHPPPQMSDVEAEAYHTAFNSLRSDSAVSRE